MIRKKEGLVIHCDESTIRFNGELLTPGEALEFYHDGKKTIVTQKIGAEMAGKIIKVCVYVSVEGKDATGDGTSLNPYRTLHTLKNFDLKAMAEKMYTKEAIAPFLLDKKDEK